MQAFGQLINLYDQDIDFEAATLCLTAVAHELACVAQVLRHAPQLPGPAGPETCRVYLVCTAVQTK